MKRKRASTQNTSSKRVKRTYNKKYVSKAKKAYQSVGRKGNVSSLVGRKHIKSTKKYAKPNAKLARQIRMVSQKQALKDLPVYDAKDILLGAMSNPSPDVQVTEVRANCGVATVSGIDDTFTLCSEAELEALLLKGFLLTNSTANPQKFNVVYAKKTITLTNNTFAYIEMSAIEYVFQDSFNDVPVSFWSSNVTTLPKIAGGPAQNITQIGQRPYDVKIWKDAFKHKETKFTLAPGAQYTHTMYCSNVSIDFADWNGLTAKKGITKGVFFIYHGRELGTNATATQANFAVVAGATAQITARVDAHYKITAPEGTIETEANDKFFRGVSAAAYGAGPISASVFDRTAVALSGAV